MVQRERIALIAGALASVVLPGLAGCVGPPYGGPPPPPYPPYYYDYYYYPHADVYFHIYTGYYWYFDGRVWRRVHRLPPRIYLSPQYRVLLRIPDERPYKYHEDHRRRYPPPQSPPETRPRVPPQTRAQPPSPPSREREERERRDREERERNLLLYEEYQKKRRPRRR